MASNVNVGTIGNGTTFTIPVTTTTNQIHISNGSTGSYNNGTTFTNSSGKEVMRIPSGNPALEVTGKIKWNGEDLQERLERIENLLHIPTRDVILEEKYQKLNRLWNEYKKALEEYKTWETLKESK
jgi:hypothetical protein